MTGKLEEELVSKIQKLAEKEHRSLTNYIEVMFIEKSQSVAVGGKKNKLHKNGKFRKILCFWSSCYCWLQRDCLLNQGR